MLALVTLAEWALFGVAALPASDYPTGGGACTAARDCQLAGECQNRKCVCDPGWTGPHCSLLDLAPLGNEENSGAAWNSEHSPRSSWGAAPIKGADGKYHGWFNQLPDLCGLSSWLPGSYIEHGVAETPEGPFKSAPGGGQQNPPPSSPRNPLSQYATNPHAAYVESEKTYLVYFNGRNWPHNDVTGCQPNKTGLAPWHGGGSCATDKDCPGFDHGGKMQQNPGKCVAGKCQCEHHSFGLHCEQIVETVNLAHSTSPDGPWTPLLPDGAPFFADGNSSLALSNPSPWVLKNGTVVLAYSRAPGTGVAVAPHWRGPYTRLSTWTHNHTVQNFALVGCGEDPFIYQDFRGTWRVICHGPTEKPGSDPRFPNTSLETGGMAFSTDLIHWTAGPGPAYTSAMEYTDGSVRPFARRERPALLLDEKGFPTHLYNGIQGPAGNYSCHSDNDRGCHTWSSVQATRYGAALAKRARK